jgi:hypothetical protein
MSRRELGNTFHVTGAFPSIAMSSPSVALYNGDFGHESIHDRWVRWHRIVEQYSQKKLTFSKDVLPALQGVAERIQSVRQSAYYAGIWADSLFVDLIWQVQPPNVRIVPYWAPSWSWASTEGGVRWWTSNFDDYHGRASILVLDTTPVGQDPLGKVIGGTLKMRALCLEVEAHSSSHGRVRAYGRCGVFGMKWLQDHPCTRWD